MNVLRVARGVLGTALTWGAAWSVLGVTLRLTRYRVTTIPDAWGDAITQVILPAAQYGFLYGAAMGAGFALFVLLMFRRSRSLGHITVPWFGLFGMLVAAGLHGWITGGFFVSIELLASSLLGFGTASSTLLLARRMPRLSPSSAQIQLPPG